MKTRHLRITLMLVPLIIVATACGSSASRHTQLFSPSPTDSSTTSSSASSTSPSPTDPTTSTSNKPTAKPVSTPTVAPAGQGAVNAYIADFNSGIAALRDPAGADLSWIVKYETGKFRTQDQQSFAYLKAHHLAYRGATPNPNVKVQTVVSPNLVILTSCQLVDRSSPWMQYDTRSGKAVPTGKTRTPPPPYLLQLYMQLNGKGWQVSSAAQDTSKTCKA